MATRFDVIYRVMSNGKVLEVNTDSGELAPYTY